MSQKAEILAELKAAGPRGILSKHFYATYKGRAAARIKELRDEGNNISSTREGKYSRYAYHGSVGIGRESGTARDVDAVALGHSPDSGAPSTQGGDASARSARSQGQESTRIAAGSGVGVSPITTSGAANATPGPASSDTSGRQAAGRALPSAVPPCPQSVPEALFPETAFERMRDAA